MGAAKKWATIVTSATYSLERFVSEAERLGVNRVAPSYVVKKLKWGDPVICLWFQYKKRRKDRKDPKTGYYIPINAPSGYLWAIGYFNLETISPRGISVSDLQIKGKVVSNTPTYVSRYCGSYIIASVMETEEEISAIAERAENLAKERGVNLTWFIGGPLVRFPKPIKLGYGKFFRGYKLVNVKALQKKGKMLVWENKEYSRKIKCKICGKSVNRFRHAVDEDGRPIHFKCRHAAKSDK